MAARIQYEEGPGRRTGTRSNVVGWWSSIWINNIDGMIERPPMDAPTAADVQRALQALAECLPGRNDPHPTGTGELDNGEVRHLLAGAAFTVVLRSEPIEAFD